MIKEISFETIKECWKMDLWKERMENNPSVNEINLSGPKEYKYKVIDHISPENIKFLISPTHIAYYMDDKIVGVESGYRTSLSHYRIRGLWVHKDYRNIRIASEIVSYFEKKAKECRYLWSIPRENSIGFYLSIGFEIIQFYRESMYGKLYIVRKGLL